MPKKKTAKKAPDKQVKNRSHLRVVSKATQFKPGQSGNPKGRPRKADCLTSLLKEEIEKVDPDDKEKRTHKELIVIATMRLARKGNAAALREVWERMDGRVLSKLEVETKDSVESDESKELRKEFTLDELKKLLKAIQQEEVVH